uniref:Glutamyl-tRNA synthetase (GltX) n=1 Tax=uncultured marine thaumarchaeote SAT1000_07_E02 TaxID=1456363 RepID=A0A075I0A3_9ARCH|nr:glutamyl-tRNA synthetase (gltX) [uncultured marine thaumarchaeote SAT1000_07_E02]
MTSCKCSNGDVKQNKDGWEKMFNKYKPGEAIVRFRGDMESKNTVMRDPVLFRINDARHPRLVKNTESGQVMILQLLLKIIQMV